MRTFCKILSLCFLLPLNVEARWQVKSQFQLHLSEKLFDQMIEDFWQSLQGQQNVPIGNFTITPEGIPIQIQGVRANVNYSFPLPRRTTESQREWELETNNLSARLFIDRISATQTIVREIDGIQVIIRLNAECRNIALSLPQGLSHVKATISAKVEQNQVKLSMPAYEANWIPGSWNVDSISCTGVQGFDEIVKTEALKALMTFQNFDPEVRSALNTQFEEWSKNASLLLLSQSELPTGKDYVRAYYEPEEAIENGMGLLLKGFMRFDYPYVSQGQDISQEFFLDGNPVMVPQAKPQILLPFGTVRALMMGEYFAGKLEHSIKSNEIPAFTELMQSRWKQFWGWPDLMNYYKDDIFALQFLPMGPPSFRNERSGGAGKVNGELVVPLSVRMFAPRDGKFIPYVEFRSTINGSTSLQLEDEGKITFTLSANQLPITYGFASSYIRKYNPSTKIAIDTMAEAMRKSLDKQGFSTSIPTIKVGKNVMLYPQKWNLEGKNLRLDFTTVSGSTK
ncbi:MAG: hypothetical protein M9962_03665 [Oligoflexia bacterium]|nr:hypothetical protein [Oligoflexia bacterium]